MIFVCLPMVLLIEFESKVLQKNKLTQLFFLMPNLVHVGIKYGLSTDVKNIILSLYR